MTPQPRGVPAFFAAAFSWNFGLGMTHILVPLYAYSLGFSGVAIGSLVALPVLVQVGLNLLAGAWTDRIGGRSLALAACAATAGAAGVYAAAHSYAALFAGQLAFVVSRALFWPATWSLATMLPGDRGHTMGRLNSITSLGQILGTGAAGLVLTTSGFGAGFAVLALVGGLASFALMLPFKPPTRTRPAQHPPLLANYARLLRRRKMYFAVMCAYLSALPFSLSLSFYPILLVAQGFSSDATGWMIALRGVGSVAAGFIAARIVRRTTDLSMPLAAAIGTAASVFLVATFRDPIVISTFLFGVGLGSGVMTLYFQLLISELSAAGERGSALALGGLGWSLSHLSTPLMMGVFKDAYGIVTAFQLVGGIALLWALALAPVHRWAFRTARSA